MKKISLFLLALLLLSGYYVNAQQAGNVYIFSYFKDNGQDGLHLAYSHDGLTWRSLKHDSSFLAPAVSNDKLMRDPCIIRGADGLFHMVWTVSWNDRGIGYATSKDLVHWSSQQYIPVMEKETDALNCWAPEITCNAATGEYMIYWATTIPGKYPATDTLGDGKYNHRMYYTLTKNFKTFTPAKVLYNGGFSIIDATIQPYAKGYVMFFKNETLKPVAQKNLHVAFSKKLNSGYGTPSPAITGNYWAEGPTALNTGKAWIVYFDKYMDGKYGAVTSTDLKTWTDISDKISFPEGTRHGTVFTISEQEFISWFGEQENH